jgi:GTP pyrophosphokinase
MNTTFTAPTRLASLAHPTVQQAITFSREHLSGIHRKSGENYCEHGIEVAMTLEEVTDDASLIAIAVLHDILVHPHGSLLLEQSPLSAEERELVRAMHDLRHLHIDVNTQDLDRVLDAFTVDGRLLLLRMAHRLNDVRHLNRFAHARRKEIARETLHMYTAISGRLGFQRWRWQMEDICFLALQPRIAKRMERKFEEMHEIDETCLKHTHSFLLQRLKEQGIHAEIDERIKGLYSTYRKMVLKNRTFEEVYDRIALRVLVTSVDECYRALGIIHTCMRPIQGKLKDYIGMPKENGYRSIHTVVYPLPGISELPIEIQIRTFEMHRECEYGVASHGEYKNWSYALGSTESRANLFRNLEGLHAMLQSKDSFTDALRNSFRSDKVLVFDPQNCLHYLPAPSSALDFACHARPDACLRVRGVLINGRERPLSTTLRDGDTVDVLLDSAPTLAPQYIRACQQKMTRDLLQHAWKQHEEHVQKAAQDIAMAQKMHR